MGKKRKPSDVLKFPVRRAREAQTNQERKLSGIIKEMALRLLKKPDTPPTVPAVDTGILLASAAWNAALGETGLRDRHREMLKQFDWDGEEPWAELVSTDTDRLIAGLVEYKQVHYPNDRRLIIEAGMSPEGNVQVHWLGEDDLVTAPFGAPPKQEAPAKEAGARPIAKKLVAAIKNQVHGKVVNLEDVIAGRAAAVEKQKTVVTKDGLARLHPAHAAYVFAQNQVSVLSEQITALDEMAPFVELVSKAEDLYWPSGPPMSPLTGSYFTSWAFFDACVGAANETIGTCIIEVAAALAMDAELLRLIRLMQRSRMGIYVHEGCAGDLVTLREIVTGSACRAIVPAGYRGQMGELWYVRVLPPPAPGIVEHLAFSTPYVLVKPGLAAWQAYFRRTLPDAPQQARLDAYERHMKYGPTRTYWNDFVFEGYVNHRTEAIFLAGLPDIPESRPHSEANN